MKKSSIDAVGNGDLTEQSVAKFERETVLQLIEVLPAWYQQLGPGLDTVFFGLSKLVFAADEAASTATDAKATQLEIRMALTQAFVTNLAIPKLPKQKAYRAGRLRALGGAKKAQLGMAYEARTLSLISADFGDWYDEVGIGGFLRSILELVKTYAEIFHAHFDDASLEPDKVYFLSAFELRQRFNKIPKEILEATDWLAKVREEEPAAA